MKVIARAPTRIDLAGGTLDIWPLYLLHPGSVTVNVAVALPATAEVTERDRGYAIVSHDRDLTVEAATAAGLLAREPRLGLACRLVEHLARRPLTLTLRASAPAHAGLGGSSAIAIAAVAALARFADLDLGPADVLALAQDIETQAIAVPTGRQDYVPALHGGLLCLHWERGGMRIERLAAKELASRIVLAYTGAPRFSGANNWEVTRRRIDGDPDTIRRLDAIGAASSRLAAALRDGDLDAAAAAMRSEWHERRLLTPGITTPEIDGLEARALAAGALAFKVCGAGGGGAVVAMAEPGRREAVREAFAAAGAELLTPAIDEHGLELVVEAGPKGRKERSP